MPLSQGVLWIIGKYLSRDLYKFDEQYKKYLPVVAKTAKDINVRSYDYFAKKGKLVNTSSHTLGGNSHPAYVKLLFKWDKKPSEYNKHPKVVKIIKKNILDGKYISYELLKYNQNVLAQKLYKRRPMCEKKQIEEDINDHEHLCWTYQWDKNIIKKFDVAFKKWEKDRVGITCAGIRNCCKNPFLLERIKNLNFALVRYFWELSENPAIFIINQHKRNYNAKKLGLAISSFI